MRKSLKTALMMASFVCVFCFGFFFAGCGCNSGCKVTFDSQGGTAIQDEIYITQGKSFTEEGQKLPTNVTKENYLFDGWYDKASGGTKYTNNTKINAETVLYAHWLEAGPIPEIPTFTITFNLGNDKTDTQEVAEGSTAVKPADPEAPANQVFVGWYDSSDKAFDFSKAPTADVTLTPKFVAATEVTHTITYDLNWTQTVTVGEETTNVFPTDATELAALKADVLPADMYAQDASYSEQRKANWTFQEPTKPELTGYSFEGWYKEAACTTKVVATDTFNADKTLYAKWTKGYNAVDIEVDPYFVYLDSNRQVITGLTAKGKEQNELTVPEGVTTLTAKFGNSDTANGQNLVKLNLPSTLTTVHRGAFTHMYALWIVTGKTTGLKDDNGANINFTDKDTAKAFFANGENVDKMYIGAATDQVKVEKSDNGIIHYKNNILGLDYACTVAKANKSVATMDLSEETFTHITGYCFWRCKNLTTITLPKTLQQIYFRAFVSNTALTTVIFDGADKGLSSLQVIGKAAFRDCTALTSIVIPAGVSTIYYHAFLHDDALTSATFMNKDNWNAGSKKLTATNMGNTETAATYIKKTYVARDMFAFVVGDVTGDGNVDGHDVNMIEAVIGGTQQLGSDETIRADINCDGVINGYDKKILEIYNAKTYQNLLPMPAKTLSMNESTGGKLNLNKEGDSANKLDAADKTAMAAAHQAYQTASDQDDWDKWGKYDINNDGSFNSIDVKLFNALVG